MLSRNAIARRRRLLTCAAESPLRVVPAGNEWKMRFFDRLPDGALTPLRRLAQKTPFLIFCLLLAAVPILAALAFSLLYLLSFLAGLAGHYPCREFFLWFPCFDTLFTRPRGIAEALFASALAGACVSWLLEGKARPSLQKPLALLGRSWNVFSLLLILSLLCATLGQVYISFSTPSYSLLGVLPHSDANVHSLSYSNYFHDFAMGDFALRRPLGAFMGAGIHWLGGCDPEGALLVRCLLAGFAMWTSCAVMNRLFGVWSALGCLAIEYYHIGKFLGVGMTESLGFFWGCCAVALWLQSLRGKSLFWDLAAFTVTLLGLLTRMGSMFLAPALFVYILWRWRRLHAGRGWLRAPLFGLCLCVAGVVALDASFARRGYGDTNQTGSNFSVVIAALSLGTDFSGPLKVYAKELAALKGDRQSSRFLYEQSVKNILHDPGVFIHSLLRGEVAFISNLHFFLFYNWWVVCLLCLLLLLRRKALFPRFPAAFWCAVWIAIFLSIPFIYFVESRRVNIFVYPLIACFFSLGLARPRYAVEVGSGRPAAPAAWATVALSGAMLALMAGVAWFPRLFTTREMAEIRTYVAAAPAPAPNTVLASPRGRGFLVVPDGEKADPSVLTLPWSTFRERYRPLVDKADETIFPALFSRLPFAVLNLPVLAPGAWDPADAYFIAPPEVLTQKKVPLWDLVISRQIRDKRRHIRWNIVTAATPVRPN